MKLINLITLIALLCVVSVVGQSAGTCDETTGVCLSSKLYSKYVCKGGTTAPTTKQCLENTIALAANTAKSVKLTYQLPTLMDGTTLKTFVLPTTIAEIKNDQSVDANKALFGLATALKTADAAVGSKPSYFVVMQGMSFKAFNASVMPVPRIENDPAVPNNGQLKPCFYKMGTDGKCVPKQFKADDFKFSFAAFQSTDCENPTNCTFNLRAQADTANIAGESITFNGDASMTLASPPAADVVIKSMRIGKLRFTYPSGVNVNNEKFVENGCAVYVTSVTGTVINFEFRVAAPGKGKFAVYDPSVDPVDPKPATPTTVPKPATPTTVPKPTAVTKPTTVPKPTTAPNPTAVPAPTSKESANSASQYTLSLFAVAGFMANFF